MSKAFVQRAAPQFKGTVVEDGLFKDIALSDYIGRWVVLFFYPLDFTFVCPTEILAFNRALPHFEAIDCDVIAASTDSIYSHLAWSNTPRAEGGLGPNLRLPLLADKNMTIARDYGVLIEEEGVALRGLFIIDPKGILRQITINDQAVGRSVEETLRLVKAFQYTDKHGEVCPADWKEGEDTMVADVKESRTYFAKNQGDTQSTVNGDSSKKRPSSSGGSPALANKKAKQS